MKHLDNRIRSQLFFMLAGHAGIASRAVKRHGGGYSGDDLHGSRGRNGSYREPQRSAGRPAGEARGKGMGVGVTKFVQCY